MNFLSTHRIAEWLVNYNAAVSIGMQPLTTHRDTVADTKNACVLCSCLLEFRTMLSAQLATHEKHIIGESFSVRAVQFHLWLLQNLAANKNISPEAKKKILAFSTDTSRSHSFEIKNPTSKIPSIRCLSTFSENWHYWQMNRRSFNSRICWIWVQRELRGRGH